jgi:hypothetical protein
MKTDQTFTRYLRLLVLTTVAGGGLLWAQEEANRPVGEVTPEMIKQMKIPRSWVGAGDEAGAVTGGLVPKAPGVAVPAILPTPQEVYAGQRTIPLGPTSAYRLKVEMRGEAKRLTLLADELHKRLARLGGTPAPAGSGPEVTVVFALDDWHLPVAKDKLAQRFATLTHQEGYVLSVEKHEGSDYVVVLGKSERALWRAMVTVAQLVTIQNADLVIPEVEILDYPQMEQRALIMDLGGQGYMVGPSRWDFAVWRNFIDWMVDHKFNEVWFEIIGSGRLMGNLKVDEGEWIGFPLALESYPELVCRDRPIRRWDEATRQVVADRYTAPNVRQDFLRELIDYTQARGMKAVVFVGYDYFANQLPFVLGVPANDPSHPAANKVYDKLLAEIVRKYDNAQGVIFHTIENKRADAAMVDHVVRRTHEGRAIVKAINPAMDVGILNDYLEWRPRTEFEHYSATLPEGVYQVYSPHAQPLDKAWLRIHRDVFRYSMFTQYAWNHAVYIMPQRIQREIQADYINGYRKSVSQAWYAGVFKLNFMTMAEMTWNSTGRPLDEFWGHALTTVFGPRAAPLMREAFAHTRFDRRLDIVGRMLMRDQPDDPYQFWDMYKLTSFDSLNDAMLAELEDDAAKSLAASREALPAVTSAEAREMVEQTLVSAERRLYLATSARHYLRARQAAKAGNVAEAQAAMARCMVEGQKLLQAATKLGIEYPMAVHEDEIFDRYLKFQQELGTRP